MQKITTFITYKDCVEDAMNFYTSIFNDAKIIHVSRMNGNGPVFSATIQLEGQEFILLNGGPSFSFSQGISLFVKCFSQEEIDHYWEKLLAGGGKPLKCGWLEDKFGVCWQIVPPVLGELLSNPDPVKARRVMEAMMQMVKIDIDTLKKAGE